MCTLIPTYEEDRLHTREKFGLEIGRAFETNCEIILRCIARKYSPDTPYPPP